jgi:membrane protease YdiL (CAAX protease family)
MRRTTEKKPIGHALIWIIIYIVLVNIGDALVAYTHIKNLATSLLLMLLAISIVLTFARQKRLAGLGLGPFSIAKSSHVLYYLPLLLLVLLPYIAGINPSFSTTDILLAILLMLHVGFLEELLFRGLLLQAIREKSGVRKAVIISGITFGIGHMVNLLRGYGLEELASQIVIAIVLGIILSLLVVITRNLLAGIIFHILFNIGGTITNQESSQQRWLLVIMLLISIPYLLYLLRLLPKAKQP